MPVYILPTSILAPSNLYAATWQWASIGDCLPGRAGGVILHLVCKNGGSVIRPSGAPQADRPGGGRSLFTFQLIYTWKWRSTHLRGIMGCPSCEIWRQSKDCTRHEVREWHVATDRTFIYCIRNEQTSISAMSVAGIFIYITSTLQDRRKANPGFTNSPFNEFQIMSHPPSLNLNDGGLSSYISSYAI